MTTDAAPPQTPVDRPVGDSARTGWVERAPERLRPFLRLARYDRPIGFWLLAGPGWFGVALANIDGSWSGRDLGVLAAITIGSLAMRGAGCTYNDIVDKDLDAQVARTANRPLAAGTVSLKAAWAFLALQCLAGLAALLVLPRVAQIVALASLPLVAAYPFMKRITWFPQAWLGLTFSWAVLPGYAAAAGRIDAIGLLAYAGLIAWVFGYDTIYAHQDKEDDALVGVKSTARFFGRWSRLAVGVSYALAASFTLAAGVLGAVAAFFGDGPARHGSTAGAIAAAAVFAGLLAVQVVRVRFDDPSSCLAWFKFNRVAITAASLTLALTPLVAERVLG